MIWLAALAAVLVIIAAFLVWAALESPVEDSEPSRLDIKDGEF